MTRGRRQTLKRCNLKLRWFACGLYVVCMWFTCDLHVQGDDGLNMHDIVHVEKKKHSSIRGNPRAWGNDRFSEKKPPSVGIELVRLQTLNWHNAPTPQLTPTSIVTQLSMPKNNPETIQPKNLYKALVLKAGSSFWCPLFRKNEVIDLTITATGHHYEFTPQPPIFPHH